MKAIFSQTYFKEIVKRLYARQYVIRVRKVSAQAVVYVIILYKLDLYLRLYEYYKLNWFRGFILIRFIVSIENDEKVVLTDYP